jgi:hypothetical protein
MWKVSRTACPRLALAALGLCAVAEAAHAQYGGGYPYPQSFYNNQSVQYGLNLPQVPVSNGSDEIRAADGTTCKSSISGNGPMLDVGVLGNQDFSGAFASGTVFGRITMPLGQQPKRLDCTAIYKLELERLQHELRLVRMGMNGKNPGVNEGRGGWQNEGWSNAPDAKASLKPSKVGAVPGPRTAPRQPDQSAGFTVANVPQRLGAAPAVVSVVDVDATQRTPIKAAPIALKTRDQVGSHATNDAEVTATTPPTEGVLAVTAPRPRVQFYREKWIEQRDENR